MSARPGEKCLIASATSQQRATATATTSNRADSLCVPPAAALTWLASLLEPPFMSFLDQLANLFTRSGRDDNRLKQGMDHAHANRPEKAIATYDALLNCKTTSP